MKRLAFLLAASTALVAGCAVPSSPPSPSSRPVAETGLEGFVSSLGAANASVRVADSFDSTPFRAQGRLLCLGKEEVRVYIFPTEQDRAAAAKEIDPNDPSHIGRSIVEWIGNPRFWQRDRIIVLYAGPEAPTEALLSGLLGPPFARGPGMVLGGPPLNAC